MENKPYIIALTGAESTGKRTLAEALANYYRVPFIAEFAREHVRNLHGKYSFEDVEFIARKQIDQYNILVDSNHPIVILDTWLLITKVWFEVVYKQIPDWLENSIRNLRVDLFLVCDTDLPWEADDVRENGGEIRNWLQQKYIDEIEKYGFTYRLVQGSGNKRTENAVDMIELERKLHQQI